MESETRRKSHISPSSTISLPARVLRVYFFNSVAPEPVHNIHLDYFKAVNRLIISDFENRWLMNERLWWV
jgi:hypothetical protein